MKGDPDAGLPISKYAAAWSGRLVKRLEARMARAVRRRDPDSIHDLRVAIRRLGACLTVFGSLLPGDRKIQRALKKMMDLASGVRDCDIALDLSLQAGLAADSPIRARLENKRRKAEARLFDHIERRSRRGALGRWRKRLEP